MSKKLAYRKPELYKTIRLKESHWPADTNAPLMEGTLVSKFLEVVAEVPDHIALVEGVADSAKRRRWTYAQLLVDAEKVASALLDRFKPGERIAIWADNVVEFALFQYGCAIAGIIMVTVNPAYKMRELEYVLNQSGAAGLFLIDEYRGHNLLATTEEVREKVPTLREVIRLAEFDKFMNSGNNSPKFPEVKPMDALTILYTSGTTGFPKGATLHHHGRINCDYFIAQRTGFQKDGVWVNPMPMFHNASSGLAVTGSLLFRGTHVLAKEFNPELFMNLVETEGGTFSLLVPTMIEAILAHPDKKNYNLSTLTNLMSGSAMVEYDLVKRTSEQLGCTISIVYGLTEGHAPTTATFREDAWEDQASTVGQPMPQCEVMIANPQTGRALPLNTPGEILLRGYQKMLGYWNKPEETAKMIDTDGWLHSGDVGTMDERGFVKITGRLVDMIIRGGENIYAREIENLLEEHPKVSQAAVIGVPDQYWGEQVGAFIVSKSSENQPTAQELFEYCSANLTHFKCPKIWYFRNELFMTHTGKVQKFKLKELIQKDRVKAEMT